MGMIQRQVSTDSLCEALAYDFERTPSGHLDVKPAISEVKKVSYSCRSRLYFCDLSDLLLMLHRNPDVRQRDCDGAALYERVSEGFDGRGAERADQKDDSGGDTSKHSRRSA